MNIDEFTDLIVDIEVKNTSTRCWTEGEENLLRQLHGHISEDEIAEILGRSVNAVHIHAERELHLPAPTSDPEYISARKMAGLLGLDNHITPAWIDRGLMPGEYIPRRDNQLHRRIKISIFINWILNPENWIWFDIHRVSDPYLKEILEQAEQKWGDEWWTTNQVAEYHHVNNKDVLRLIKQGKIKAIQAHNRSGRNFDHWANWFILRSEATKEGLVFKHRKKRKKGTNQ